MSKIAEIVEYFQDSHNIALTPAGRWHMKDGKKLSIDAKRVDNLSWDNPKYANDNMGRLFLTKDILVLDIDGADTHVDTTTHELTIIDLDMTIPFGLYTTTTQDNKYHFYYKADTDELANRIKGLHNLSIDIFTYGVVFEAHTFSEFNELHKGDIIPAPQALIDSIEEWMDDKGLDSQDSVSSSIGTAQNPQRFNLVEAFLADELTTNKQRNAFYRSIMPNEYMPKNKRKIVLEDFELCYDLFNKVAVKLTATSELDFNKHTVPTLRKLLMLWGKDPDSRKSKEFMWGNILPSLPQHESIFKYTMEEDDKSFQEHLRAQTGTATPVFRVLENKKIMFFQVDKYSELPIPHGDSYYFDRKAAEALNPERAIENEEGKVVGWDDGVPIVYTINNPYEPQYHYDDKYSRHTINLYTPTDYVQNAEPKPVLSDDNLIYKVIYSTIGPEYLEIYLAYSAQVLFGRASPTLVLWMAALKTELGGSGKSVVTLELFSLMLGTAAAAVDTKTVNSGWGDIVTSTKLLSLEDMPELTTKDWENVYANIKQQNTNSYRKLNMKGGAVTSKRVSIAITGSTNHRLHLSPSDRRFLCLEPAHFHGITEPLCEEDKLDLARLLASFEYDERVQDYVDYLLYIYNEGFSEEVQKALFIEAPETIYRRKWVAGGESNSQRLIQALPRAQDLIDLCKIDDNNISEELPHLIELLLLTYNAKAGKMAVSWKWIETILPYIQSTKYKEVKYSKSSIANMLQVDFKNVGSLYTPAWKEKLPSHMEPDWKKWPVEGYVFKVTDEEFKAYQTLLKEMINGS